MIMAVYSNMYLVPFVYFPTLMKDIKFAANRQTIAFHIMPQACESVV